MTEPTPRVNEENTFLVYEERSRLLNPRDSSPTSPFPRPLFYGRKNSKLKNTSVTPFWWEVPVTITPFSSFESWYTLRRYWRSTTPTLVDHKFFGLKRCTPRLFPRLSRPKKTQGKNKERLTRLSSFTGRLFSFSFYTFFFKKLKKGFFFII